jgi:DNA transformation protein
MPVSDEFRDFVADQLEPLGAVQFRRMFGGVGLFRDGLMFGLIDDDTVYLKADAENLGDFEQAGMPPFTYRKAGKTIALSYRRVPAEVLEDSDDMTLWAQKAIAAAARAKAA